MSAEQLVERFNNLFPVGSTVRWRSIAHPNAEYKWYKVSHAAYLNNGQPVVFFEGKSGFVSIEPEFVDYGWQED